MAIPVIDFSKLASKEREETLAQITIVGCEEWGFFQLVNHGIPGEVLDKVKKVCSEYYKLKREEDFKKSSHVQLLIPQTSRKGMFAIPLLHFLYSVIGSLA